jgi:anhydro-N-acetylmuramic acid kinase
MKHSDPPIPAGGAGRHPRRTMLVLGIMSGTSLDGVDYALCSIGRGSIELDGLWRRCFPGDLSRRLHRAAQGQASSHELAQLHHDLGRFYAAGATQGRFPLPQLVGLHGQTVFHHPSRHAPATLQLGEPAYLAEAFGVPVISNFRAGDLAAGGEGAPLATLFHLEVFGLRRRHVCVNNLGGISNVTSIDWRHGQHPRVAAFDTGPANVLLDLAVRHFTGGRASMDRDGRLARRGVSCEPLLRKWMRHPYFRRKPPKSTGRECFGELFLATAIKQVRQLGLSECDVLATLTELSGASVALNYRRHLGSVPDQVILTGGGAANPALVDSLRRNLLSLQPSMIVSNSAEFGWPLASIEPAAFALLAWRRLHGLPGNLPATTGARHPCLLGQISSTWV